MTSLKERIESSWPTNHHNCNLHIRLERPKIVIINMTTIGQLANIIGQICSTMLDGKNRRRMTSQVYSDNEILNKYFINIYIYVGARNTQHQVLWSQFDKHKEPNRNFLEKISYNIQRIAIFSTIRWTRADASIRRATTLGRDCTPEGRLDQTDRIFI